MAMSSCQPWRLGRKEQIKLLLVHFWHYHSDKTLAANKNCLSQVDNFIYNQTYATTHKQIDHDFQLLKNQTKNENYIRDADALPRGEEEQYVVMKGKQEKGSNKL